MNRRIVLRERGGFYYLHSTLYFLVANHVSPTTVILAVCHSQYKASRTLTGTQLKIVHIDVLGFIHYFAEVPYGTIKKKKKKSEKDRYLREKACKFVPWFLY
ncbi:hypothetical protein L873DRAFT_956437 [Choiromyces venosus 120613-1]|uniref:Uncharacterized protein n=1 Tax=Choiromyces venosus 120613-1 TaxID=1336337 RepID=A0A3N4K7J0_9PEZI|nr:hypothetical protein L873DRAFT_956437 [Choiromyces venosus 120613-1]